MKTVLLISTLFSLNISLAQAKIDDYISYYNNIHEANFFFYEQHYDSAIVYFEKGLSYVREPRPKDYYNYCRALLLTGHQKFPEYELMYSKYIIYDIVNGPDSILLKKMSDETKNDIALNIKHNRNQIVNPHKNFIDSICLEDQKVRKKVDGVSDSIFFKRMEEQDSMNQIALLNYAKTHGFPAGINGGWDQPISVLLLHFSREWFVENYHFLVSEIKKGNLEPWMLSQGIDRMFIKNNSKSTEPFNSYFGTDEPDAFLVFKNCASIGLSPYYDFDHIVSNKSIIEKRKPFYEIYKQNKKVYNLTFF